MLVLREGASWGLGEEPGGLGDTGRQLGAQESCSLASRWNGHGAAEEGTNPLEGRSHLRVFHHKLSRCAGSVTIPTPTPAIRTSPGPSSTWIPLLTLGALSAILSISTRKAVFHWATHDVGAGVAHCPLGVGPHLFFQASPGLGKQEQWGQEEEQHGLGRRTERKGHDFGSRTRYRAWPSS